MKKILTGNEAIARGAYEAGCTVAAAYPGTPSTEILENMIHYQEIDAQWSPNEKVALEVACGASIGGARSLAAMKHVGLNVAADPLFTIAYEGVNGGLVIVSADDPGCHSSQNEQDNRFYAYFGKLLMLEPSDSQECKDFVKLGFILSERFDIPVLLRVSTRICHSKSIVELNDREKYEIKKYIKNVPKYVMTPDNARKRHVIVEEKLDLLRNFSNKSEVNKTIWGNKRIGIITSGISYQHAHEVFGEGACYLKLGLTNPLPYDLIKEFSGEVQKIYVIEENDPYLELQVKSLGIDCIGKAMIPKCGELNSEIVREALLPSGKKDSNENPDEVVKAPSRPPVLCAGCPHRGIFYAISKYKDVILASDIGCYTLGIVPPLEVSDTVLCMGAGISAAIGIEKSVKQSNSKFKVFGCMGDSTFFHSGITGLIDAVYNKSSIVVTILDNSITAMTGHQDNPGTGKTLKGEPAVRIQIEEIMKAVGVKEENIKIINPYDLAETEAAVKEAYKADEIFAIISRQPCALLKDVQKMREGLHCEILSDRCKKCKKCLSIGCPAIALKDGMPGIDKAQCNGCGLCSQLCKFDAIEKAGE